MTRTLNARTIDRRSAGGSKHRRDNDAFAARVLAAVRAAAATPIPTTEILPESPERHRIISLLATLRKRGLVVQVTSGGPRTPATWRVAT